MTKSGELQPQDLAAKFAGCIWAKDMGEGTNYTAQTVVGTFYKKGSQVFLVKYEGREPLLVNPAPKSIMKEVKGS